jgi:hypothetical protein
LIPLQFTEHLIYNSMPGKVTLLIFDDLKRISYIVHWLH